MSATILDGRACAATTRQLVKARVDALIGRGVRPALAVVLVGDDPGSAIYVRNKIKACEEVGVRSIAAYMPASTSEEVLLAHVDGLNADPEVDGILVQLPMPGHIAAERVIERVSPAKDVDGFHPLNLGRLAAGRRGIVACTPAGIVRLLDHNGVAIAGAHVVLVGRGPTVGRPLASLLVARNATVTICHTRTRNLQAEVARAEILVVAAGHRGVVQGSWVPEGAVVVDTGVHRGEDGKLCGDLDFAEASIRAAAITPVPGGVGPMTIAMLMSNTVDACVARRGLSEDR